MSDRVVDETKIEVKKVDHEGSLFETLYNYEKRYYYCPICGSGTDAPIFFFEEDLIAHIISHVKRRPLARKQLVETTIEEEEEE